MGVAMLPPALSAFTGKSLLPFPVLEKGDTQLFSDDILIENMEGVSFKAHPAKKLEQPVLSAEMKWEMDKVEGEIDKRVYIYGTVIKDESTGEFTMWYNRGENVMVAKSMDGVNWERPILNIRGKNNIVDLNMHSPSIIYDRWERDPQRRYKAVGSTSNYIQEQIDRLKGKFEMVDWYRDGHNRLYSAAYSPDGINWTTHPEPILLSADTITLAQDDKNGEYLVFHKRERDPRVKGRQIFLSTSQDFEKWTEPKLVLQTDEIDHADARKEVDGTHSEFYNMSAFQWGNQWLGLVTQFRVTGKPKVKGPGQSGIDGPADIQVVTSRDGKRWERCRDRSPVIPIGPDRYDGGTILGVTNTPVVIGDEMCMYYAAMTTTHAGAFPEKEFSIGKACWRIDGLISIRPKDEKGYVVTAPFLFEGSELFVNADLNEGSLMVEVLNEYGSVIQGFEKENSLIENTDGIKIPIRWNNKSILLSKLPIQLRFYIENGDLYSYTFE